MQQEEARDVQSSSEAGGWPQPTELGAQATWRRLCTPNAHLSALLHSASSVGRGKGERREEGWQWVGVKERRSGQSKIERQ